MNEIALLFQSVYYQLVLTIVAAPDQCGKDRLCEAPLDTELPRLNTRCKFPVGYDPGRDSIVCTCEHVHEFTICV